MARPKPVPHDRERPFAVDELFFSTTDAKGLIRSGNDVFCRVSGFAREELVGEAHNVVRHPDMPRAVFRLFWDELSAGRPIAAYVKNLATDGSFYWVIASAVPVDDGYVSVRLKPTSPLLARVDAIYREVRRHELEVEDGDPRNRKASIDAGGLRLLELLAEEGFASYDAFIQTALPAEITARETALGSPAHVRLAATPPRAEPGLAAILRATSSGHQRLDALVRNLSAYGALSAQLAAKSDFILGLADDVRLFSLNAMLAAARLGDDGASLGAVASIMRSCSDDAGPVIASLNDDIGHAVAGLGDLSVRVAASKLQAEMVMVFVQELFAGEADGHDVDADLRTLASALRAGTRGMLDALDELSERLRTLLLNVRSMHRTLDVMRALEVNGRIEAVRYDREGSVEALFRTIAEQVALARAEMAEFAAVARLTEQRDLRAERALARDIDVVGNRVRALAAAG